MLNPIAIFNGGNYSKTRVNREQSCIVTDIYENGEKKFKVFEKSLKMSPFDLKKIREKSPIGSCGEGLEKISYNSKMEFYIPAKLDEFTKEFVHVNPLINNIRYESLNTNKVKEVFEITYNEEVKEQFLEHSYGDAYLEQIKITTLNNNVRIERRVDLKRKQVVLLSNNNSMFEVIQHLIVGDKLMKRKVFKKKKIGLNLFELFETI